MTLRSVPSPSGPPVPSLPRRGETIETSAQPTDEVMWSVTTLIGILDKPALIPWACNTQAERTVENIETIRQRIWNEGSESAIEYVSKLRWQTDGLLRDSQLGTVAHGLFDEYALSGRRPDVVIELHPDHAAKGSVLKKADAVALEKMLDGFDRFLQEFQPEFDCCEVVVYSPQLDRDGNKGYGYAGQADAFVRIGGMRLILDYKTSRKTYTAGGDLRKPYPEVGLQLAAYRHATYAAAFRARRFKSYSRRYYMLSDEEKAAAVPVPEVEGGVAVRISPDHMAVYPVRCDERQWEYFLHCQEVARWQFNESKWVVGNPMMPVATSGQLLDADPFAGIPSD